MSSYDITAVSRIQCFSVSERSTDGRYSDGLKIFNNGWKTLKDFQVESRRHNILSRLSRHVGDKTAISVQFKLIYLVHLQHETQLSAFGKHKKIGLTDRLIYFTAAMAV